MWFLRKRRRRRLLAEPISPIWRRTLQEHLAHYRFLGPAQRAKLEDAARIIEAETYWEGCGGLALDDRMRILIAANAALLVLENEAGHFESVTSVLVYPAGVIVPESHRGNGIVAGQTPILGQASFRGPIILSWSDALYGSQRIGARNVVLHEFAHALDMLGGIVDGTPPMPAGLRRRWADVCQREYDTLNDQLESGLRTVIDPYAATNPAEFFAVVTEHFFEQPHVLHDAHPELWEVFADYYGYAFG
jgi:Mlc titration factor MtfA (ptsG expression regulator)